MNLEDHLGDVVRKARLMSRVSAAAAARAAGLSEPALAAFEGSGRFSDQTDFTTLAPLIGLDAAKLAAIAIGWLPAKRDLCAWRQLRVITTADDEMTVNCFLVWDEATRDAALFDTGFDLAPVLAKINANQLQLRHIFITHGHSDHIGGLHQLREKYPHAALHAAGNAASRQTIHSAAEIRLGGLCITSRDTPGHADDGVTYLITNWPGDVPSVAIVGDAIFAGSMGRAADWDLARRKVREQILSLPDNTLVCPGHGPLTTVAEEINHNPFF